MRIAGIEEHKMIKNIIFRWHGAFSFLSVVCACIYVFYCKNESPIDVIGPVLAGALGFSYFSQQQKLAEIELFKALFTEFNYRYDLLNDNLQSIRLSSGDISSNRSKIIDYFNLCAEEYLFYKQGYILADVWRSWCNGMLWYLEDPRFKQLWNEEAPQHSYYGLSIEIIRQGAERE